MFVSYAQNFEDVILMRAFRHVDRGTYIDIGANDPVIDSVSLAFYERGWRGVHVEPVPLFADRLRKARPDEEIIAAAVGQGRDHVEFFQVNETGLSTGDPAIAGDHERSGLAVEKITVPLIPLSVILDKFEGRDVHWLKIDVEGMEEEVIASWAPSIVRPWVVVVESTRPNSPEQSYEQWEKKLNELDYDFIYFDGLNRFYINKNNNYLQKYFGPGPNYFDDFTLTTASIFARLPTSKLQDSVETNNRLSQELAVKLDISRALDEMRNALVAEAAAQRNAHAAEAAFMRAAIANHERHAASIQAALTALRSSTSWRITAPIRAVGRTGRFVAQGIKAWGTLAPGSRPWRVARKLAEFCRRNPRANASARLLLRRFPALKTFLRTLLPTPAPSLSATFLSAEVDAPTIYLFVDHTAKCHVNTGVQRTARGLASGLTRLGQRLRYVKWDAKADACVLLNIDERTAFANWNGPEIGDQERATYTIAGAPSVTVVPRDGDWLIIPEVTHTTFQKAPVTLNLIQWARRHQARIGCIFYDAIPLHRDEFAATAQLHRDYMRALRLSDVVWPISRWSANDLASFWAANDKDTSKPAPPLVPLHLPSGFDGPRVAQDSVSEPMILSFGTIEPRKNQVALIRAFQKFRKTHPNSHWRLVLVGNLHSLVAREVEEARVDPAIQYLGHIRDEELSSLLNACAFTVFPSVEEGFGLPILESLWRGKPCVCADFGAMEEVAEGGGCLTVDVRDEGKLAEAVRSLIEDENLRGRLTQQALQRTMSTWEDYADSIRQSARATMPSVIYFWVDATAPFPKNTGIQRVVRQLARKWMEMGGRLIPVKFDRTGRRFAPASPEDLFALSRWNGPAPEQWAQWVDPSVSGAGSWFIMAELPLHLEPVEQEGVYAYARAFGLQLASVFYDTIPWKMRGFYPEHFSLAHKEYMLKLADFDLVLAISKFSAEDMKTFLDTEAGSKKLQDYSFIIPVPLPAEFPESDRVLVPMSRNASGEILILCVGTVEPRKNHRVLLKAFEQAAHLSSVKMRLIIAGRRTEPDLAADVEATIARIPSISWEEDADDARLRALHLSCDFTVYPSLEEGFGLPILESLWYAKPAICANFGAMAEVAEGGGCVTIDVRNVSDLATAIQALAEDPDRIVELSREAVGRTFTAWADYARDIARLVAEATPIPPPSYQPPTERLT